MNKFPRSYSTILLLCALAMLCAVSGCNRRDDARFALSGSEKRYELKGKVVAVDVPNQNVTIAHEDIKDFMPAMTMPFTMRDEWAYNVLAPGDQITATLIVDGTRSWIQDVVLTKESSDPVGGINSPPAEAREGDVVPNYGLVNQDNKRIKLHNYRGLALLLTFIYTRCPIPDYCNLMSDNFAKIEKELDKKPELLQKTHLLSISIDPDYDTPPVLRSYGAAHTGKYSEETFNHWELASGTKDEVKGVAQFFGLRYYEGNDQIIHGLRTVIIDPNGRVYKVYRGNGWKPEEVLRDLESVFAESK